jgi:hypothetical protein
VAQTAPKPQSHKGCLPTSLPHPPLWRCTMSPTHHDGRRRDALSIDALVDATRAPEHIPTPPRTRQCGKCQEAHTRVSLLSVYIYLSHPASATAGTRAAAARSAAPSADTHGPRLAPRPSTSRPSAPTQTARPTAPRATPSTCSTSPRPRSARMAARQSPPFPARTPQTAAGPSFPSAQTPLPSRGEENQVRPSNPVRPARHGTQ